MCVSAELFLPIMVKRSLQTWVMSGEAMCEVIRRHFRNEIDVMPFNWKKLLAGVQVNRVHSEKGLCSAISLLFEYLLLALFVLPIIYGVELTWEHNKN